jgi:hypothetical protein
MWQTFQSLDINLSQIHGGWKMEIDSIDPHVMFLMCNLWHIVRLASL